MINPLTHRKILKKGKPGRARITAFTMPERGADEAEFTEEKRRLLGDS